MRKEGLKKDGAKNGTLEEVEIDTVGANESSDAANLNGDAVDPLDGADPADNLEISKKKTKKGKETVVEVPVPTSSSSSVSGAEAAADTNADGDDAEEEGDYEVEDIVDHKTEKKKKLYLVRWKNYGAESDTWEPEASLSCPELIKKYNDAHNVESSAPKKKAEKKTKETAAPITKKSKRAAADKPKAGGGDVATEEPEEDYEVEDIVNHKTERGKTSFLIRWKGWASEHDTWEPESTLSCPEIVEKYKKANMADAPASSPKKSAKVDVKKDKKEKKGKKEKKSKGEDDYEVQLIVDEKTEKSQKLYLVRWKGWSPDNDTWEPESSLNCPDLIKKFQDNLAKKRPSAPKRGSAKKPKYAEIEEDTIVEAPRKRKAPESRGATAAAAAVEDDYEVEDIVDQKTEKGKKFYLVKWKGWAASSNTWEPESSLSCPDIVKKYLAKASTKSPEKPAAKKGSKAAAKPAAKSKAAASKKKGSNKKATSVEESEEKDWEVEQIMDVKYNDDGTKDFLIRWKGCDASNDTWEPENNVDCPALINKFMNKEDDVPKKKSRKA